MSELESYVKGVSRRITIDNMKRKAREKMKTLKWEIEELDKRVDFLTSMIDDHRDGPTKLSLRARHGLVRAGVFNVFEIENITLIKLYATWNVGKKTIDEIVNWMKKNDLKFKEKESEYAKD